ncbi:MAG TPA: TIGR02186 family protein, partial [Paracoccaceae bacterium]|nr:TIGR02186 family protein [Paracoccaceae bacterium]
MSRAGAVRLCAAMAAILVIAGGVRVLAAETVVASLSQHDVSLTTGFAGSEIFVYGAVRRTAPRPEPTGELDIIITVTGPEAPVVVRRKERHFGIWTNGPPVQVDAAPSFYVVASSDGFRETITWTDDLRYRIGLDYVITLIDAPAWIENREAYRVAVARVREAEGLYSVLPNSVRIIENT